MAEEQVRQVLVAKIRGNAKQVFAPQISTLMEMFGYQASMRVRQTSLRAVLDQLDHWNIDTQTPHGIAATNRIRLSLRPAASRKSAAKSKASKTAYGSAALTFRPLEHLFGWDEQQDFLAAIWAHRPVLLEVICEDDQFAFLGGFLTAVLQRRALIAGNDSRANTLEIHDFQTLRADLGRRADDGSTGWFPAFGSVLLTRSEGPEDINADTVARVRELLIPHTYRLKAHDSVAEDAESGFGELLEWLSVFSGGAQSGNLKPEVTSLGALMADAAQAHDALIAQSAMLVKDPAFAAGYESTEHMVLKSGLLSYLSSQGHRVAVEAFVPKPEATDLDQLRNKPDLVVGDTYWVEVETLRGLGSGDSDPFLELERKMRQRVAKAKVAEVWLIVPSDVAALATDRLTAIANNLSATVSGSGRNATRVRWGYFDLVARVPVFIKADVPKPRPIAIAGKPWTDKIQPSAAELTWADVAGYAELRKQVTEDVLTPIMQPGRFERHGLPPANGLLLYGLPGCGKTLVGRVLAGEANVRHRILVPSDMSSMWLGEGVQKIRDLFDWALRQDSCLLIVDELDAVAPQRREHNMHSDEKRAVNELLAQLDRLAGKPVMVVATTNYLNGIDSAIRRSGRFDIKVPVFPPNETERAEIFAHYLSRLVGIEGTESINVQQLAAISPLFAPADIASIVQIEARRAVVRSEMPTISDSDIEAAVLRHPRSIRQDDAERWLAEVQAEMNPANIQITWLESEIARAYPPSRDRRR